MINICLLGTMAAVCLVASAVTAGQKKIIHLCIC